MAADAARKLATYDDVLDAPENMVAEILDGELHLQPRPRSPHAAATSALGEELGPPFKRGRGGPGGWLLLFEPELHLGRDVVVPDIGGWRRERMPEMPDVVGFTLAPDFCCEVISPSTEAIDRGKKLRIYAREGVIHVWFVNPTSQTLEVLQLEGATYRLIDVFDGDAKVRAKPFDAIELDLAILWAR